MHSALCLYYRFVRDLERVDILEMKYNLRAEMPAFPFFFGGCFMQTLFFPILLFAAYHFKIYCMSCAFISIIAFY